MASMNFMKLKFFELMFSFVNYVQAEETSVDFSINRNSLEGQSQTSSRLSGNKLNFFGKTKLRNCSNFHPEVMGSSIRIVCP